MRILDAILVGGFLTGATSALAQGTPPATPPAEAQQAPETKAPADTPPPAREETTKADEGMKATANEGMKPKATPKTKTVMKPKTRTVAKTKTIKRNTTKAKAGETTGEKKPADENK